MVKAAFDGTKVADNDDLNFLVLLVDFQERSYPKRNCLLKYFPIRHLGDARCSE